MTTGERNVRVELESLLSRAALDRLFRPTEQARGLPGRAYTDPAFLALERETLFRNCWVGVATASEIPAPGDAVAVDLADHPLLLVRDEEGEVRCFYNICRHRGAALAEGCTRFRGAIRCPWHGWTYTLDGRLRGTPRFGGPGVHDVESLDKTSSGLVPVRVARWFDILFVNLDGHAPPLETHLEPFLTRMRQFDFSRLHQNGRWQTHYPGNWKLAVESGIEDYHFPVLHAQIADGDKTAEATHAEIHGEDFFYLAEEASVWAEGRGRPDLPRLPKMPGLTGSDARSLSFSCLFPTTVIYLAVDGCYVGFWLPDGVGRTSMRFYHYFVDEGASAPEYATTREELIKQSQDTLGQDKVVVGSVHRGAAARASAGIETRFSPFWEQTVHGFQKRVVTRIQAG